MEEALPTSIESYNDAVRWIYDRINYERIRPLKTSNHFRLERVEQLLEVIDSPQSRIPAVHIAGTKGKGSTATILSSILAASEVNHGLFTSPHIELFEERMRVNAAMPTQAELTALVAELHERLSRADASLTEDGPTYFEVATMLAWMFFDLKKVDVAVLETGLGGRLDCTNVCAPVLTIITSIGLDHTHILGDTLPLIAAEKAGILKPGVPLLTWVDQPEVIDVIRTRAEEEGCRVFWRDKDIKVEINSPPESLEQNIDVITLTAAHLSLNLPLLGRHQTGNAALAVAAAEFLSQTDTRITPKTIAAGVTRTKWPLRFEIIGDRPPVVLDAAHNPDSVAAFVRTCNDQFADRPRTLIFASSRDKDAASMLQILVPHFSQIVLTMFQHNPRAIATNELEDVVRELTGQGDLPTPELHIADTPTIALQIAQEIVPENGVICVAGSIFIAAEVRALLVRE